MKMSQLRDKAPYFIWTVLIVFVVGFAGYGLTDFVRTTFKGLDTSRYAGEINGTKIDRVTFEYESRIQLNRIVNQGGTLNEQSIINAHNSSWNSLIERNIIDEKIEELNLTVHSDEVHDFMLQNPPTALQTNITDAGFFADSTGNFDLIAYQTSFSNGTIPSDLNDLFTLWENYLKTWLADRKLREVYNTLPSVTDNEVLDDYSKKNINVNIDYIYINPSSLPDTLFEISELEIDNIYQEDKDDKYTIDESVQVQYILFPFPEIDRDSIQFIEAKDSLMQLAYDVSDESVYSNFDKALTRYSMEVTDSLELFETLSGSSGIPYTMGNSRQVIRFAFDKNIGTTSDPIEMKNGIAVFNILNISKEKYRTLDDVKENIKRTLLRDDKIERAKEILQLFFDNSDDWKLSLSENDYIQFSENQTSLLSGTFKDVGKSSELEGALFALNNGEVSNLIETSSSLLFFRLNSKDELNETNFNEQKESIRLQLLSSKRNQGYFNWLNKRKEEVEITDLRHLIY